MVFRVIRPHCLLVLLTPRPRPHWPRPDRSRALRGHRHPQSPPVTAVKGRPIGPPSPWHVHPRACALRFTTPVAIARIGPQSTSNFAPTTESPLTNARVAAPLRAAPVSAPTTTPASSRCAWAGVPFKQQHFSKREGRFNWRVITRVEVPPNKATLLLSSTDTGRGHHKEMAKALKIS